MSATPWQGITVTGQIIALVFSRSPSGSATASLRHTGQLKLKLGLIASITIHAGQRVPKARDCVLARIAEFVENQTPLTPSSSPPPRFTKEKYGTKGHGKPEQAEGCPIVGPLIGIERGFQRIPFACGMGGIELVFEAGPPRLATVTPSPTLSSMLLLRRRRASIVKAKDALTRTIVIVGVTIELVHALDLTPKLPSRLWRSTII
ncbi:hypothetical protein C8Q74DRAFT_1373477 [Fomes fomentarius]|nr:hypothetical protein C8Q74DRAFT_1373477 [Fomes fomentarius]